MKQEQHGQEEQFINQAAHLLLALSGIKPLPKATKEKELELDSLDFNQL